MNVTVKYSVEAAKTPGGRDYQALTRVVLVNGAPTASVPVLRFKTDDEAFLFKAYLESLEGKKK